MAVLRAEAQRDIIAEVAEVWSILADVQRYPKVLRSVESTERVEGDTYAQGLQWRERRRLVGKTEQLTMRIAALEPLKRVVVEGTGEGGLQRFTYIVAPSSLGTRLRIEYESMGDEHSALQRAAQTVMGKLGAKAVKTALDEDLEDFAKACEDRVRR